MILGQWRADLSSNEITFYLVAAGVVALVCFGLILYYLKRARLIEDTPTSKIRSAAQGYVELVGAVSVGESGELLAPLSGTPCVWFDYKVQRYRSSGKNGHWHTVEKGTSSHWFRIDDKTGNCVIDPQGADVITEHSRTWYGNSPTPNQGTDSNHGILSSLNQRRYRYIEKFIYIHDVIYALGHFKSLGGGRHIPNNHKMIGEVIRQWKKNYDWILEKFDKDENGEIDMEEWEQVRKSASQEAEKRRSEMSKLPTTHLLSKTLNKQHPFILSTHSQKKLAKRYRYYAATSLVGSMVCGYFVAVLVI
jgi:E3 ubiquitin ligase